MDFKQQLRIAYDKDADRRNKNAKKRDQWKLNIRQRFIDLLKEENKKSILELGSGVGLDAKFFKDNGFDVLATDLSRQMVKMCQKRGLQAKVVDIYNLSSLAKKYDAIFSMNVLLHVPRKDLSYVLKNIADTLNDKGIFFYGVYSVYGNRGNKSTIFTDKTKMGLPRFFSFLSDKTLLKSTEEDFNIIDFQRIKLKSEKGDYHFQALFLRKK